MGFVARKIATRTKRLEFPNAARQVREQRRAEKAKCQSTNLCLLDFVPHISPQLERPDHLAPYADALERAIPANGNAGEVFVVLAAPPQHGKTELTLRAFLWWAIRFPGKSHAYVTYNADRAESVSRKFRRLAEEAGLEPTGPLHEITLKGGTEIKFTSIGGSLTGSPVTGVCVVDDPFKGPAEARSQAVRKRVVDWFDSVAFTRRHPGTSFVVMATRWHVEDLSGVLIKRGWNYINLKCIAEGPANDNGAVIGDPLGRKLGESLWHRKPPSFFVAEQKNAYWWASLYQGEPRPASGTVFRGEPRFYSRLPSVKRGAFGIDLAYTKKTSADWSICIEGVWHDGSEGLPAGLYIVNVVRKQVDAPSFALALKAQKAKRPGWRMRWYAAGTEKGSADFLKGAGIPVKVKAPIGDKLTRATAGKNPTSGGWNNGEIFLPDPEHFDDCEWLADFLDVIQNFTGIDDIHDDDVDALVALWDELTSSTGDLDVGGSGESSGWR